MLPTLKGVFPKPKTQHKRDFLRENKLHLKDLQRNSSRQQLAQKVEEEEQKLAELRRRQKLRHKSLDAKSFPISRRQPSISGCSCECGKTIQLEVSCRSDSAASKKTETCTREVQTDDILDEEFLYQALRRCSSTDVGLEGKNSHSNHDQNQAQLPESIPDNHSEAEPDFHFENLAIDTERLPATANSTQLCSKRSTRRIHELGDRQDVRLPKYLERQKREKEQLKQRELERDPNCPLGYEPVTDEERIKALNMAQKKFQDLVGELNRMPMTTETLRIRSRKAEIERQLIDLEKDIRIFSKPRVYVKINGVC